MTKYDKGFITKIKIKLKIYRQLKSNLEDAIKHKQDIKSVLEDINNDIFVYEDILKTNED